MAASTESNSSEQTEPIDTLKMKLNERKVLYGLIAYPSRRDTEICAKLDMRKSTFSTIKSRLEQQKTFDRKVLPGFPRINAEIFAITTARMSLSTQDTAERLEVLQQVLNLFREDIFAIGESENLAIFSISKNFTTFDRNIQLLRQTGYQNNIFLKNMISYHVLPFETTKFIRFFSYAPLIERLFNLKIDDEGSDPDSLIFEETIQFYNFSTTERKVFQGLLEFPDKSNRTLAEDIGVSKNTLAAMKKKFLAEKVLLPRVVPDLLKIGIKLLIFFFGQFEPGTTLTERQNGIENLDNTLKPILLATKDMEFYCMYAVTSFEEYHSLSTQVLKYFSERNIIGPNYSTVIFSLPHARILKQHEYLPLVEKLVPLNK